MVRAPRVLLNSAFPEMSRGIEFSKRKIFVREFYCLWVSAGVDFVSMDGFCGAERGYFGASVCFIQVQQQPQKITHSKKEKYLSVHRKLKKKNVYETMRLK